MGFRGRGFSLSGWGDCVSGRCDLGAWGSRLDGSAGWDSLLRVAHVSGVCRGVGSVDDKGYVGGAETTTPGEVLEGGGGGI